MATHEIPKINTEARQRTGTRYARRLRDTGRLPAVVYGHQQEPLHVSLNRDEVLELLHHNAHLLEVVADGQAQPCLIKDVQWDHLGASIIHIDLARVDLTESVTVSVDLVLVGEAKGLKTVGALLEHPLSEIEIECLATDIPQNIKIDVSELDVDQILTIADLKLPSGIKTTQDPDTIVAQISVQAEVEEQAPVVAEAAAEPEIIRAKKEEETPE